MSAIKENAGKIGGSLGLTGAAVVWLFATFSDKAAVQELKAEIKELREDVSVLRESNKVIRFIVSKDFE